MKYLTGMLALILTQAALSTPAHALNACSGMTVGQLSSLNGFAPFPPGGLR
jgi:hypothetical protein